MEKIPLTAEIQHLTGLITFTKATLPLTLYVHDLEFYILINMKQVSGALLPNSVHLHCAISKVKVRADKPVIWNAAP